MQQIQIIGHLGSDAKLIETNGNKFISFSVGVSESYTKADGSKVESSTWYNCSYQREGLLPYLLKGTKVFLQGKPRTNVYQNNAGQWQADIKVNATQIQLLSSKQNTDNTVSSVASTAPATDSTFPPVDEKGPIF